MQYLTILPDYHWCAGQCCITSFQETKLKTEQNSWFVEFVDYCRVNTPRWLISSYRRDVMKQGREACGQPSCWYDAPLLRFSLTHSPNPPGTLFSDLFPTCRLRLLLFVVSLGSQTHCWGSSNIGPWLLISSGFVFTSRTDVLLTSCLVTPAGVTFTWKPEHAQNPFFRNTASQGEGDHS